MGAASRRRAMAPRGGGPVKVLDDPDLIVEVLRTVGDRLPAGTTLAFVGAAAEGWSARAAADGMATVADPELARVVVVAGDVPEGLLGASGPVFGGAAEVVVLYAPTPASATAGRGRWPAEWADEFAEHRWRFVDLIRPVLWDDPRFGPDACEPWLVFVAPGAEPALGASPPLALLHPGRVNDAVRGVHAELEALQQRFLERLQPLVHRREVDVVRHRLADALETVDGQRQQLAALEARVAANERRLVQLMEQQLGLGGALVAPAPSELVAPRSRWRRFVDFVTAQPTVRPYATGPRPPEVSPAVVALFDAGAYVVEHPDAAEHPLTHYLTTGEALGYRPNPWFDPLFYRERYPDVARAGVSALVHYADYGGAECRQASAEFNTEWYVATYPEVRRSGLNPLLHYLAVGAALGYRTRPQALPGEEER